MHRDFDEAIEASRSYRCLWCGKSTSELKRIHPKIPRMYCSKSCSGARNFYFFAVMSILFPTMLVIEGLFIVDALPEGFTASSVLRLVLLIGFFLLTVVAWYYLFLGYRKRKEGPRWSKRENGAAGVI